MVVGRRNGFVLHLISMSLYDICNVNLVLELCTGHKSNNVQISIVEYKFESLPGSLLFCR